MTKPYELTKEFIQLAPNANLLTYKRDGGTLNAAALNEYVRLTVSGIAANQTAVFDIDRYGLDLLPSYLLANFVSNTGNITFSVKYRGTVISTFSVNGTSAAAGIELPKIPISYANTEITIQSAQPANFIWIACQQIVVLADIAQDGFI